MSFYGKEPELAPGMTMRTFTYQRSDGTECIVAASYVQFMPEHVSFWIENDGPWDTLVIAEANGNVHSVRETT